MPTEGVKNWEKWKDEEGGEPKPAFQYFANSVQIGDRPEI